MFGVIQIPFAFGIVQIMQFFYGKLPEPTWKHHTLEAIELVREFVKELEQIPDACAECFPFETIDELKAEYLTD